MPAALLARFGRATAEQVVTHIEERMAAPRRRGFRARFAGQQLQSGQERDFALGLLSQFAPPMGMGPSGAAAMGMGPHGAGAGGFGAGTAGMGCAMGTAGMGGMGGAMSMAACRVRWACRASRRRWAPRTAAGCSIRWGWAATCSPNPSSSSTARAAAVLWVWSRSSRSHFTGMEDALSLDGDVRTTMFGADYSRGALTLGLSSPLGLTARVALSWGGSAQGGAESLWGNQMAYGMGSHQMYGSERLAVKIVIVIAVGAMVIRVAVGVELDLADVIG